MTTSLALADKIVDLLKAANVAGGAVYGVRAWPTQPDQLPQIRLQMPSEDKTSLGRDGPQFFQVVASLPLILQVEVLAEADDAGAEAARADLAELARQTQAAVIGAPELYLLGLQQFPFVRSHARISADGREIVGEWQLTLGLEFSQGPADFVQPASSDLTDVRVTTVLTNPTTGQGAVPGPVLDVDLST